jgi:glycosyltransferase involved in cell wall biosynthesis
MEGVADVAEDEAAPRLSVIVPMYNAQRLIERCLAPLLAMLGRREIVEIIVVDDASTDRSAEIVRRHASVRLVAMEAQGGPGAARNLGARIATGTHLWFVDSDVVVAENAGRVLRETLARTGAIAVIGSYDNCPAAANFLSQYKNLVHHYYHHRGKHLASTFWGGCGAVERGIFTQLGGFDANRYRYPSIEDIDLGYRIADAGGKIVLEPGLQGKHLKEWRFVNLLHTEIFRRALPWTRLMLERKDLTDDLNLGKSERARALLALVTMAGVIAWALGLTEGWVVAVLAAILVAANGRFLVFFARTKGPIFAVRAFLFHQLYYAYSSAAFAVGMISHYARRAKVRARGAG